MDISDDKLKTLFSPISVNWEHCGWNGFDEANYSWFVVDRGRAHIKLERFDKYTSTWIHGYNFVPENLLNLNRILCWVLFSLVQVREYWHISPSLPSFRVM